VFYASQRELLEVVVPFLEAGLQCNERCSWEVRAPLTVSDATRALARAVPDFERCVARGQIEIVSVPEKPARRVRSDEALEERLDEAILAGFDGLRLVRHAGGGAKRRAPAGAEIIGRLNIVAAFLYPRAELGAVGLMERVQDHRFALVCNSGRWEVLEGSEARTVRDALRRSEEKLKSLFRSMSEGFAYHRIVLDAEGRPCDYVFVEVNAAFERLTGLVANDILGKRVTQVLPGIEVDPTDWIGKYGRVALTGVPLQFESHSAGLDRWYAASAFSPHKGYFAVTFADITDRKRAEAERRAAEERLLVTLRSIGDAVISTDTAGRVVILNRVAEELTGLTEAEASGKPLCEVFQIIDEETGEPAEDPVHKVMESGAVVGLANHAALVRRDGRRISIADSAAPVRSESGELLGVVLVFRDVTEVRRGERERIQVQEALRGANARLMESDRRKDEFLAILSHELRNPLAPITNSLYVLDHAQPGGEQARRAKQVIARQVTQLAGLVNDLLDVTRITRNKIQLQKERLELNELVSRAVEDNRSFFERGSVHLELAPAPWPVRVNADRTRLSQIIGNLLQNAAKFARPGGRSRISVSGEAGQAAIRVVDDGVGMSAETIGRLFQPFMQAEQTLDRSKGGLGLGLALVKGLVELHGGAISARSEGLGKGAEFVVCLPLCEGSAPELAPRHAPEPRARRRILVIEDNPDAADSLREALEVSRHEVVVAHDGPEGLEKARELRPDVVLCDIGLPGMDGYEVARAFRREPPLASISLVALSGYALPADLRRAADAGFQRHLAKPPSLEKLEEILDELQPDAR
jgi:PAS domain S-box-containing protein